MERRARAAVLAAGGIAVACGLIALVRGRGPAPVAPPPIPARREGDPADRGRVPTVGLDVERLRMLERFEPVVEYLTYLQTKRGDRGHLLFVRHADLDELAALEGMAVPSFLERLDQLGVVVSTN